MSVLKWRVYDMDIDLTQTIFDTTPVTICGDDRNYKPDIPDHVYLLWDDICEVIGDPDKWPTVMRTLFWAPNIGHWNRMKLCGFVVVNGLHPQYFMDWVDLMGLARDNKARYEFCNLLKELNTNKERWSHVYAYNVTMHRYEYITGRVRYYLPLHKKHN